MSRLGPVALAGTLLLSSVASGDVDYWQFRGIPGFVRALAVDPGNPDVLYAAASNAATYYGEHDPAGTGVLRSSDGGHSWSPSNTGLTNPLVSAIVIDPWAPTVLYAATAGGGVFKSVDGGSSWVPRNVGLGGLSVYSLAIDPQTPANLFAGLEGGGVYRSTDGAATWGAAGIGSTTVWALAIDPVTPTTVYAGIGNGVFKSTNGGTSWAHTGPLLYSLPGDPEVLTGYDVRALLVDATASSTVYAGTASASGI